MDEFMFAFGGRAADISENLVYCLCLLVDLAGAAKW